MRRVKKIVTSAIAAMLFVAWGSQPVNAEVEEDFGFGEDLIHQLWGDRGNTQSLSDEDGLSLRSTQATGEANDCRLIVWDVGWDRRSNWLGLQGGRENCANVVDFTLSLKKDVRWKPDNVLASQKLRGNVISRVYAPCSGNGKYYGEVTSSTGRVLQGDRSTVC